MAFSDQYLLVKGSGGMGNRMLCAVSGILYGEISKRKVIIDWSDKAYSVDGTNVFGSYFNCPGVYGLESLPDTDDISPEIWRGRLDKSMGWMLENYDRDKVSSIFIHNKYSINVKQLNHHQRIAVFWYYTHRIPAIIPHLHGTQYAKMGIKGLLRKVLNDTMALNDEIFQKVYDFQLEHFKKAVVGLHIRQTDRQVSLEKYLKPLRGILRRKPHARIFLATDNKKIEAYLEDEYHDRVLKTVKWQPNENETMHMNSSCPDRFQNGIEALVDMYLLSRCNYLIYPGCSTFSWISSILSQAESEHIIDIQRYNLLVRFKRWLRHFVA